MLLMEPIRTRASSYTGAALVIKYLSLSYTVLYRNQMLSVCTMKLAQGEPTETFTSFTRHLVLKAKSVSGLTFKPQVHLLFTFMLLVQRSYVVTMGNGDRASIRRLGGLWLDRAPIRRLVGLWFDRASIRRLVDLYFEAIVCGSLHCFVLFLREGVFTRIV